jgi:hypothetical protein
VIDELFKKYRPVDIISRVEMRTKLSKVSMKTDDDPRVLFNQLATIQSEYNNATQKIDPYDLIAVVLEKAPDKYKSILTAEQRHKGTNLTLEDLNNCMNDLFRTMTPNRSVTKEDNEVALTVTTGGKFKGFCRNCKKTSHKAKDCRFKKNGNANTMHASIVGANIWTTNVGSCQKMQQTDNEIGCPRREMKHPTSDVTSIQAQ